MSVAYRRYHPKWHRERMPIFWWLKKAASIRFIARELTSLGVGYAALLVLAQVCALAKGGESSERFAAWLATPWVIAFHAAILAVLVVHAVSWLHLAPKAMVLRVGGRRVPNAAILAGHYLGWIAASAAVCWILLGG